MAIRNVFPAPGNLRLPGMPGLGCTRVPGTQRSKIASFKQFSRNRRFLASSRRMFLQNCHCFYKKNLSWSSKTYNDGNMVFFKTIYVYKIYLRIIMSDILSISLQYNNIKYNYIYLTKYQIRNKL